MPSSFVVLWFRVAGRKEKTIGWGIGPAPEAPEGDQLRNPNPV